MALYVFEDRRQSAVGRQSAEATNDIMTMTMTKILDFGSHDVRGGFPAFFTESFVCLASGLW